MPKTVCRPTLAQADLLKKLLHPKSALTHDIPTDIVWRENGLIAVERVRSTTFHALVRNGWLRERGDWAAFDNAYWVISDAGRAAIEA